MKSFLLFLWLFSLIGVNLWGQGRTVTIDEMRFQFYKYVGDTIVAPAVTTDIINENCLLYPSPLYLEKKDGFMYKCFWSIKQVRKLLRQDGSRNYYTSEGCPLFLRLDSIEGLRYRNWSRKIQKKYRYYDKKLREEYAQGVTGTFYGFEPQYYMGWWVSNFYFIYEVNEGRVKMTSYVESGKARQVAFDKGYSRYLDFAGIRNYQPEFSLVLSEYVNQMEKVSKKSMHPKIYDFLVYETDMGYDVEVLKCSAEPGLEFEALRTKIKDLPTDFFTPIYTLGGVKLPGFFLEGSYELSEDGWNWDFSCRKYFAGEGMYRIK